MKIENLNFSVRVYNCLKRAGIDTVEQLEKMSDNDLLALRNFGVSCLAEVRQKVAQVKKPITNGDRIRGMTDEELAEILIRFNDLEGIVPFCKNLQECEVLVDTDDGIPQSKCAGCLLEWLQRPAEVSNA